MQDTWKIGNRLTINPGIRYEQQTLTGTLVGLRRSSNNWAPRIGATYDPTGNGTMKVYGNCGRFYARMPNDLAARALSADAGVSRADYFDANLTQPIPDGVLAGSARRSHFLQQGVERRRDRSEREARATCNEVVAGFEFEVAADIERRRALHPPRHRRACSKTCSRSRSSPYDLGHARARQRSTTS